MLWARSIVNVQESAYCRMMLIKLAVARPWPWGRLSSSSCEIRDQLMKSGHYTFWRFKVRTRRSATEVGEFTCRPTAVAKL